MALRRLGGSPAQPALHGEVQPGRTRHPRRHRHGRRAPCHAQRWGPRGPDALTADQVGAAAELHDRLCPAVAPHGPHRPSKVLGHHQNRLARLSLQTHRITTEWLQGGGQSKVITSFSHSSLACPLGPDKCLRVYQHLQAHRLRSRQPCLLSQAHYHSVETSQSSGDLNPRRAQIAESVRGESSACLPSACATAAGAWRGQTPFFLTELAATKIYHAAMAAVHSRQGSSKRSQLGAAVEPSSTSRTPRD